jgi:hypothetical protein
VIAQDPGTGSKLWLLPAGILLAAGLASLIAQIFILPGGIDAADWRAPAEYVLEHVGPDDAVTVQPSWNEDPYPYLTEVGPQIMRQGVLLLEDVHDREHVWLLSETSRLDDALARMPFEPADQKDFGPVTVVRLDPPETPKISYDLLEELASAEVTRLKGDKVARRCKNWHSKNRAWYCGKPDKWIFVGEELLDIGGDPHRCIWAHPPADQKRVRIRYADVPLGETFRFRVGLNQRAVRSERGTDVQVRASIGDEYQTQKTIPARVTRWEPIEFDTSSLAGENRDVSIEIWSESVYDRYVCFNGWALE